MGLIFTLLSFVKSSKIVMYGMIAVVVVGGIMIAISRYGKSREAGGVIKVVTKMAEKIIENNERSREIHAEIKRLPMSERAARLRNTDRRTG